MLSQFVIDYHALDNLPFTQINFISVATGTFTPAISKGYDDFFKVEKYDAFSFIQQMLTLLNDTLLEFSEVESGEVEPGGNESGGIMVDRLILVCKQIPAETPILKYESYGFVYLDDFKIIPLKFQPSPYFEQWVSALKGKADSDEMLLTLASQSFSSCAMGHPNLFLETEAFLRKHAPRLYRQDMEMEKKQLFLDSFQKLDSMQQIIDPNETAALWQKLTMLKGIDQPPAENVEAAFLDFEQKAKYPLPEEIKSIYRMNDGAPAAFGDLELLPIESVIKEWQNWKMMFDDWTLEELQNGGKTVHGKTLAMYCNPFWIPLIDNISGNYFAVDLMPGKNGQVGQIIAFGADEYEIHCIADNLNHLLEMTIALIENPDLDCALRKRLYFA
ncbi:MAG: SMI1/KNR4 family protein [Phormidesmis sp.]